MQLRTAHATRLLVLCVLAVLIGTGAWLGYRALSPLISEWWSGDVTVTIPEGLTAIEIDTLLAEKGITPAGSVIKIAAREELEGYLFPDTYRFRPDSDPEAVVKRLTDNFEVKAAPLLTSPDWEPAEILTIASLLEKEVPDPADRRIVAGIIEKRIKEGMPLQIDATICYLKELASSTAPCYPITRVDLTIASPYNTYLYRGLPPGPIGNPGVGALTASLEPQASQYWFYLSDPATTRTIFSRTNEEHEANRARYLK